MPIPDAQSTKKGIRTVLVYVLGLAVASFACGGYAAVAMRNRSDSFNSVAAVIWAGIAIMWGFAIRRQLSRLITPREQL
jgi:hypothetical protein